MQEKKFSMFCIEAIIDTFPPVKTYFYGENSNWHYLKKQLKNTLKRHMVKTEDEHNSLHELAEQQRLHV